MLYRFGYLVKWLQRHDYSQYIRTYIYIYYIYIYITRASHNTPGQCNAYELQGEWDDEGHRNSTWACLHNFAFADSYILEDLASKQK